MAPMISTILFLAQQAPAPGAPPQGDFFQPLLMFGFMGVIMYFLMIRPQQKKQKEHQRLMSSLKTGDKVVTSAGIHGLISNVKDKTVVIKVADNVKIEFDKSSIAGVERAIEAKAVIPDEKPAS
jgi:preprotein translocase subunit YajC